MAGGTGQAGRPACGLRLAGAASAYRRSPNRFGAIRKVLAHDHPTQHAGLRRWPRRAIVIDGLGSVDDPGSDPNATVMSAPGIAALRASGLTAAHFTVNQVGNQ